MKETNHSVTPRSVDIEMGKLLRDLTDARGDQRKKIIEKLLFLNNLRERIRKKSE